MMTAPTIGKKHPTRQMPTRQMPTAAHCPSTTTKNKHRPTFHLRHRFSMPQVFFYAHFVGRKGRGSEATAGDARGGDGRRLPNKPTTNTEKYNQKRGSLAPPLNNQLGSVYIHADG